MPANTRKKTNSMSASSSTSHSDNINDSNEIEGGLEAVMQTMPHTYIMITSNIR